MLILELDGLVWASVHHSLLLLICVLSVCPAMFLTFYIYFLILRNSGCYWCDSLQGHSLGYIGGIVACGLRHLLPRFQLWETHVWSGRASHVFWMDDISNI